MAASGKKTQKKKKSTKPVKAAVKPKKKIVKKNGTTVHKKTKKLKPDKHSDTVKTTVKKSKKNTIQAEYKQIGRMLSEMRADIMDELTKKRTSLEEEKTVEIEDLDAISADRNREYKYLLTTMNRKKLSQIDEALVKMQNGAYGICEECGDEIPIARLKVLPFTKLCVDCASNMEKEEALKRSLERENFTGESNGEESNTE